MAKTRTWPGSWASPLSAVLAGFRRIHLAPGASQAVTIGIDARALSQVDRQGVRKVRARAYKLHLGGGQPAFAKTVTASVQVEGEKLLPK